MHRSFELGIDYLVAIGGIIGYVAVAQLAAWRGREVDRSHLWNGLWALGALAFVAGRWLQIGADVPAAALFGSRVQNAAASMLAAVAAGVVEAGAPRAISRRRVTLTLLVGGAFAVIALGTSAITSELFDLRVDMIGRRYWEPRPTPVQWLEFAFIALTAVSCALAVRRSRLIADRESRRAIRIGAMLLIPVVLVEILHALQLVNLMHVAEFALLAVVVVMNHTLTARHHRLRQVRHAIDRAEQSFAALAAGSRDGVVVHRNRRILFANPAAAQLLRRASAEALLDDDVTTLLPEDERDRAAQRFVEPDALSAPTAASIERFVCEGGEILRAEAVRLPIVFDGLPATVTILKDISERERMHERTRFVEAVLAAQDEERRRIARELHDEAGQALTSVLVGLRELEELRDLGTLHQRARALRAVAGATLDDLGRLARGLHPQLIDDLGFTAAVERYAAELADVHGIAIDVEMVGMEPGQLSKPAATALYRVVQEALTNAIRHGHASQVSLVLQGVGDAMHITIEDDGRGFASDSLPPRSSITSGFGLRGIRERVALLGGSLEVDSTPGAGTTLIARVPFRSLVPDA